MPEPSWSQTAKHLALTYLLVCIFTADSFFNFMQIYANGVQLSTCRNRCRCFEDNRLVNCTDRAFREIPNDIPPLTINLDFNWNFVDTLTPLSFATTRSLQVFSIANNRLRDIKNGTFDGLLNLTELALEDNVLTDIPSALIALSNLMYLDLSRNKISAIDGSQFSDSLRELYLAGNFITAINGNSFYGLKNIETVDLSKNRVQTIDQNSLLCTPNLKSLNIVKNSITILPKGWLGNATNLLQLYLTGNRIKWTADVRDWFTSYSSIRLQTLFLNKNHISSLPASAFRGLSNMESLTLSNNFLQYIPASCFNELNKLDLLLLNNNRLKSVPSDLLANNKRLRTLVLRANKLRSLPAKFLKNNLDLDFLDLAGNNLAGLPKALQSDSVYPNLTKLDLRKNQFTRIPQLDNFPSLMLLVMSSNRISELSSDAFASNPYLMEINLDSNMLQSVSKRTFSQLQYLQVLTLEGNNFMCDCQMAWLVAVEDEWGSVARHSVSCKYPYALEANLEQMNYNMEWNLDFPGIDTLQELNDLCNGPKEKSKYIMIACIWILILVILLVAYWSRKILKAQKRLNAGKPKIQRRYSLIPNKVPTLEKPPWRSLRRHSRKRNGKYTSLSKNSSPPRITVSCLPHSGMVYKQRETTV